MLYIYCGFIWPQHIHAFLTKDTTQIMEIYNAYVTQKPRIS